MQTQHRGGLQPSDQANRLGLQVCQKEMAVTVHIHIHIHHRHFFIITQPESWYSFYRPTEDGRLSRPRHCSKGVQPVPKAEYRSGCRDEHNCPWWDSNLGPLTPQSGILPLDHWDTDETHNIIMTQITRWITIWVILFLCCFMFLVFV